MFSLMGLSSDQVTRLREEFGIYMVGDSRINIAGLNKDQIDYFSSLNLFNYLKYHLNVLKTFKIKKIRKISWMKNNILSRFNKFQII